MKSRISRLSPSMVIAVVALFAALGGTGYAATVVATANNAKEKRNLCNMITPLVRLASERPPGALQDKAKNNSRPFPLSFALCRDLSTAQIITKALKLMDWKVR